VPDATRDDLDPELVALWATTARELDAHGLGRFDGEELLLRAGVISDEFGTPTAAGLLALARHPQQFFPRFVVNLSAEPADGARNARARILIPNDAMQPSWRHASQLGAERAPLPQQLTRSLMHRGSTAKPVRVSLNMSEGSDRDGQLR
jgi:hypothetical protein